MTDPRELAKLFPPRERKPLTNYDLIVSKSPEELAEWIETIASCERCPSRETVQKIHGSCVGERVISRASCKLKWLAYLKQEAQGGV